MKGLPAETSVPGVSIPLWRPLVAAAVFGLVLLICRYSSNPNSETRSGVILALPEQWHGMTGIAQDMSVAEKRMLPEDTQLARRQYSNAGGDSISCSIVLAGGEKRSIHRPEVCLPGQGWAIQSGEVVPMVLADGRKLELMKLVLVRDQELGPGKRIKVHALFMYWFVGKGVTTPYHGRRVFLTSWDRVFHNLNHRWAYVIVSSLVTDNLTEGGKNEQETSRLLLQFASELGPLVMKDDRNQVQAGVPTGRAGEGR